MNLHMNFYLIPISGGQLVCLGIIVAALIAAVVSYALFLNRDAERTETRFGWGKLSFSNKASRPAQKRQGKGGDPDKASTASEAKGNGSGGRTRA